MVKKLLIFLIILIFASFCTSVSTRATEISALMEFQLIDLGAPWVGGQLLLDTSPEIPGRSIQPDNVSLTYVLKPTNYTGKILRSSLVYDMGGDLYSGIGAGWGRAANKMVDLAGESPALAICPFQPSRYIRHLVRQLTKWKLGSKRLDCSLKVGTTQWSIDPGSLSIKRRLPTEKHALREVVCKIVQEAYLTDPMREG